MNCEVCVVKHCAVARYAVKCCAVGHCAVDRRAI